MSEDTKKHDPDRVLIDRMAAGDAGALAELYDRFGMRVAALARTLLGDADDAEDIVEETFWQAWRTASRYDARRGRVSNWLLTVAHSRALDLLRSRRRRAGWRADPTTAHELRHAGGTKRAASDVRLGEAATRSAALTTALDALPAEQREVIQLAFLEGLSHSEIAERTGQPLGTLKTRIRLGMEKLRDSLAFMREEAL